MQKSLSRFRHMVLSLLVLLVCPATLLGSSSIFTETVGFATKVGYRGVFAWKASQIVNGRVLYGASPGALDRVATTLPPTSADTAQLAVAYLGDPSKPVAEFVPGQTIYWQVEDTLTGQRSEIKSLRAVNAYNDFNGQNYTLDMLVQLDLQDLPPDIPHDLALANIADGINIFAERVFDGLDTYARLGRVIITDTNLDYAANEPFGASSLAGGVCRREQSSLADVLVQTTIPFDSHTWGGWSIANPCIAFYVGRIGQLVVPWEDEFHFGYVSTHELMHYAFNTPDLYPLANPTTDCRNPDWDGSIMHNTGGFEGRWVLTELDRNPTLTPCVQGNAPYSWDSLRARYTNVPLNAEGPIDNVFNSAAKGDPDGDGLEIWLLNREPGASTLTRYFPNDTVGACGPTLPPVTDKRGDGTGVRNVDLGLVNDPSLDVTEAFLRWSPAKEELTFNIRVNDLQPVVVGAVGNSYRWIFDYEGVRYQIRATRDATGGQSRSLRSEDGSRVFVDGLKGSFDTANDLISITLPAGAMPFGGRLQQGSKLEGFEIFSRRDYAAAAVTVGASTAIADGSFTADTARGSCHYIVNQENFGPNDAPVAVTDSASTDEDTAVVINVLANDTDANGDPVALRSVSTKHGIATINPTGTITFTPKQDLNGTMRVTYTIHDGKGATATGTVNVTVAPTPDTPVAAAETARAFSSTSSTVRVLQNDSDPDGEPLTVIAVTNGTYGTVTTDGSAVVYTPGGGLESQDSFTYTISDGTGRTSTATVTMVRMCISSFFDDLEPAPESGWGFESVGSGPEGTGISLTTWSHVIDPAAKSPNHSFFSDASQVSAYKDDRLISPPMAVESSTVLSFWHRWRYEHDFDGCVLEVTTDDGDTWQDVTAAGGVFLVGGYNATSQAMGGRPAWGNESELQGSVMIQTVVDLKALAGKDVRVRWRLVTDPLAGEAGWWVDDIRFENIAITHCGAAVNRAPVANDDEASAQGGSAVAIDVLANDSDPDADPLSVAAVTQPANGMTVTNGSTVTYRSNDGFAGSDTFTYTVTDGFGGSATANVVVQVNGAPVAANDSASTHEEVTVTIDVVANDTDPNGDALTVTSVSSGTNGSTSVNGDNSVTYRPNTNFHGTDRFTYTVSDGNGGSASASVDVVISGVNDTPVAANDSARCSKNRSVVINVLANDTDADGDSLTVTAVGRAGNGGVNITTDGRVQYTPKKGFTGTDSFTYSLGDGNGGASSARVTVTVQ